MKQAIIYARISTDKEKQNIKQQIAYVISWASKNEYSILKVFKDEKTGKTSDRRGYIRMLEYLSKNPSISLIVQDTDRLTRNFYDAVELEKFIISNDIELVSLSEKVDLKTPNGRFMFRIKSAMNNFYVENLVQKIKVGVERAKKEGKYKGRPKGLRNKVNRVLTPVKIPNI